MAVEQARTEALKRETDRLEAEKAVAKQQQEQQQLQQELEEQRQRLLETETRQRVEQARAEGAEAMKREMETAVTTAAHEAAVQVEALSVSPPPTNSQLPSSGPRSQSSIAPVLAAMENQRLLDEIERDISLARAEAEEDRLRLIQAREGLANEKYSSEYSRSLPSFTPSHHAYLHQTWPASVDVTGSNNVWSPTSPYPLALANEGTPGPSPGSEAFNGSLSGSHWGPPLRLVSPRRMASTLPTPSTSSRGVGVGGGARVGLAHTDQLYPQRVPGKESPLTPRTAPPPLLRLSHTEVLQHLTLRRQNDANQLSPSPAVADRGNKNNIKTNVAMDVNDHTPQHSHNTTSSLPATATAATAVVVVGAESDTMIGGSLPLPLPPAEAPPNITSGGQSQGQGQNQGQGQGQGEGMFLHAVERMIPLIADAFVVSVIYAATVTSSTSLPLPLPLPPSPAPAPALAPVPVAVSLLPPVPPPESSFLADGGTTVKATNTEGDHASDRSEAKQSTDTPNDPSEPHYSAPPTIPLTTAQNDPPPPFPNSFSSPRPSPGPIASSTPPSPTRSANTSTPPNPQTGRGGRLLFESFRSVVLTPVGATPLSPDRASRASSSSSSSVSATAAVKYSKTAIPIPTTATTTATTTVASTTAAVTTAAATTAVIVVSAKVAEGLVDSNEVDDANAKVVDETVRYYNDNNDDKDKSEKDTIDDDRKPHVEEGYGGDGDDNDVGNTRSSPAAVTGDPILLLHRVLP